MKCQVLPPSRFNGRQKSVACEENHCSWATIKSGQRVYIHIRVCGNTTKMKCHVHAHQSSCKQVLTAAYLNKLLGQVTVCSILQLINLCFPLSSQSFKCILILPLHCASGNIKDIIIIYYLIRSKLSFSYNFNYESKIYVVVFQGTSLASSQIDFFLSFILEQ